MTPCHGVLLVEDDADIRQAIVEALADHDIACATAENGAAALERLRAHPSPLPCLILLDMMMPVVDGRGFRETQRADPAIAHIPVIVLTAHASGDRHAAEMAVDGFLRKPVDLRALLAVVGRYCPQGAA